MLLLTHICLAIMSLLVATFDCFRPSRQRTVITLVFTALTLASGTVLVVTTHAVAAQSCLSGACYLAIITTELLVASKRLAIRQD